MNSSMTPNVHNAHANIVQKKSLGRAEFVLLLLHDVTHCLMVVTMLFIFLIRIVTVVGDSMMPTLHERDVLILLSSHWYQSPKAGDVVVAQIPDFSNRPIVKRVAAVEGDVVDFDPDTGMVSVNGNALDYAHYEASERTESGLDKIEFPITVKQGCVFLLGDNRNVSLDSRYAMIDQVDKRHILGKVMFVILPGMDDPARDWSRIGLIE